MSLVLDRYEVVRRLAVGGMGEVFLAVQRGAGDVARSVILKAMLPDLAQDTASVQAFLDEARVVATLNHPNVVSLYEVGVWQGLPLIAMEFVRGRTVSGLIKRCLEREVPVPPGIALTIARDAARGLHHAHQAKDASGHSQHLIHRDISPQNIMVRTDGVAKVLDFGIAHTALRAGRTATGLVKGKLAYMAPEQARGDRLDQRADQFALGIVLWELLTQRRLYKADTELELLRRVEAAEVPLASSLGATPACDALLGRMLSPRLEERFADCGQAAAALDELISRVGGGGTDAVAAFMTGLGEDDVDAATVPNLGEALSPLSVPPRRADVHTATSPARPALLTPSPPPRPRRRWVPGTLGLVLLLGLGAGGAWWNGRSRDALQMETRLRIALEQNARFAEKTVDGYCADSARLAPLFPRVEGPFARSAAPFLEPLIGWEHCEACSGTWVANSGALEPPQRLVDKMTTPEDASVARWRTVLTREDLAPLDFTWLNQLPQFDHWWLSEHPRTQQFHGPAVQFPLPNYLWLQWWAKARFARALHEDDLPRAAAEVGQLRRLLRTQGTLVADMIALAMQGIERGAVEESQLRGLSTAGLAPLTQAQSTEIRSVAFTGHTYAWPGVNPVVMERAYACSLSPCVMLLEAAWLNSAAGHLAPTQTRAAFDALVQRSQCDRASILASLSQPGDLSTLEPEDLQLDPLGRVFDKL